MREKSDSRTQVFEWMKAKSGPGFQPIQRPWSRLPDHEAVGIEVCASLVFRRKGVPVDLYVSAVIIARIIRGLGPARFEMRQNNSISPASWGY